jgi:hypothetical protein
MLPQKQPFGNALIFIKDKFWQTIINEQNKQKPPKRWFLLPSKVGARAQIKEFVQDAPFYSWNSFVASQLVITR